MMSGFTLHIVAAVAVIEQTIADNTKYDPSTITDGNNTAPILEEIVQMESMCYVHLYIICLYYNFIITHA